MNVEILEETNLNLSLRIYNENDTIANIIIDSLEKNKNIDFFTFTQCWSFRIFVSFIVLRDEFRNVKFGSKFNL